MVFADRDDAGRRLAARLGHLRGEPVVVLGLPRGGVPVAFEVARALGAPLDVIVVRKLGVPFQPELGMGAVGEDGVRVINPDVVRAGRGHRTSELARSRRGSGPRWSPRRALPGSAAAPAAGWPDGRGGGRRRHRHRVHGPGRLPGRPGAGAPRGSCWPCRSRRPGGRHGSAPTPTSWSACSTPARFCAIGQFYADFSQIIRRGGASPAWSAPPRRRPGTSRTVRAAAAADPPGRDEEVEPSAGVVRLAGYLTVPENAPGIVVFAHGSGSSRHSPRNRYVAGVLNEARAWARCCSTCSPRRRKLDRANVFDIGLLAGRLAEVTGWLRAQPRAARAAVGYFGASTGAAAALRAAAEPGAGIAAVVSRGGRPDLARPRLARRDRADAADRRRARRGGAGPQPRGPRRELRCENGLAVVPGATHLFEEPGTLDAAAGLARDWFLSHLTR